MKGAHYVYRLFASNGRLLYVGTSRDVVERRREHKGQKFWWSLVSWWSLTGPFNDYPTALQYEREAIKAEVPRFNDRSNVNRVVTPEEHEENLRLMDEAWGLTTTGGAA